MKIDYICSAPFELLWIHDMTGDEPLTFDLDLGLGNLNFVPNTSFHYD